MLPNHTAAESTQITIQDIAFGGKGVGRKDGLAVFVPFVITGEEATVRVTKRKKKFAEADLVSVDAPSPDRVQPECRYYGRCGGCAYQHIGYERQLQVKSVQVEQALRRLGRFAEVPMRPAIASPLQYGYRNRIRVHASHGAIGFFRHDRHEVLDVEQCPIAAPAVNGQLANLRRTAPHDGDFVITGEGRGEYFIQTNDGAADELLKTVKAMVSPALRTLVDAYCGAGFFARSMAPMFQQIIGIEENERAIECARRTASSKESYALGDVSLRLGDVLTSVVASETCLVLDPPAIGADGRVLDLILASMPAEIIYVSCNPATLARDLEILCHGAYKLSSVTPLDMFPQTAEIEVVAHLTRQS